MVLRFVVTVVCLIGGLHDVISRQGCCGPKQWTGVAIQKLGRYDHDLDVASLADISTNVAYDYVAKKISLQQKIHNITTDNKDLLHVIYDFKQKTEYTITNGKVCIATPISEEMWPNCVPENASHLGTYNISGPVVDVYRVVTPGGATVRFSVTYEVCYPGTESLLTSGPVYDLTVSVYENVTTGIPDPSVFNVPVFCHHRQMKTNYTSSTITELIHRSLLSWR